MLQIQIFFTIFASRQLLSSNNGSRDYIKLVNLITSFDKGVYLNKIVK